MKPWSAGIYNALRYSEYVNILVRMRVDRKVFLKDFPFHLFMSLLCVHVCVCAHICVPWPACGGQRPSFRIEVSPSSTVWILSPLVASGFTY